MRYVKVESEKAREPKMQKMMIRKGKGRKVRRGIGRKML